MLQVCVAIVLRGVAVSGISNVEAVRFLPRVRHAIAIQISRRGAGFELRPAADFLLTIDAAMRAVLHARDNALIRLIAYLAGSRFRQDEFIGQLRALRDRSLAFRHDFGGLRELLFRHLSDVFAAARAPLEGGVVARVPFWLPLKDIAVEEAGRHVLCLSFRSDGKEVALEVSVRPWTPIVRHEVEAAGGEVAGTFPIVDDIVAEIEDRIRITLRRWVAAERRMAVSTAEEQVVMDADAALDLAKGHQHRVRLLFVMRAVVERLAKQAPLHRETIRRIHVHDAVDAPCRRHMIEDHIPASALLGAETDHILGGLRLIAQPKAHEAHDDIRALAKVDPVVPQGDSSTWSRLPSQGEALDTLNAQLLLQRDRSTDVKHHRARHISLLRLDRIPQAALATVVEVRHMINICATPAFGKTTVTFGARKGDQRLSCMQIRETGNQDDDEVLHEFGGCFTDAA